MSFVYITEQGTCIKKRGGRFVVTRKGETVFEIPSETLTSLVVIGSVQISSQAIIAFLQKGVPVTWLSSAGRFFGRLESTSNVHVFRQQKQIQLYDSEFSLSLSKKIILSKTHNQITVLRRYNRKEQLAIVTGAVDTMCRLRKNILRATDRATLMGHEGMIARTYFQALGQLVPEAFCFPRRSRRPPLDPFNAMLSLGYTLLMYEFYTAITNHGLNPYFGFFHVLQNHHPALASDLMEEWRAILIDRMVLSLISRHEIAIEHFVKEPESQGVFLTREGRSIFLKEYEKRMRSVNQYTNEKKSFRKLLALHVENYEQALMAEDAGRYIPIYIR